MVGRRGLMAAGGSCAVAVFSSLTTTAPKGHRSSKAQGNALGNGGPTPVSALKGRCSFATLCRWRRRPMVSISRGQRY